uniref:Avh160 n=1 Tax=Phytophthora sojae TaxID=67593 RepID=G1FRP9_PHYSO|nr:Avh160 [Phytophthora sojae]
MVSKSNPLNCSTLLALLALAASVGRVLATSHSKITVASTPVSYDVVDPNQVGGQTPRHLRALGIEDDDSSVERAFPELNSMLKIVRPDKQDKAKNLFVRLKLHESTSNLFGNPKFQEWMRSVEKSYKKTPEAADAAMVLTMTTQFGDDGLAKLLLLEKTSPDTKEMATRLEGVQFKNWIDSKQTATGAFKLLKLDQDAGDILKNPLVSTWMSYVKLRKESPINEMLLQLKTRYGDGALARMLGLAKQDSSTSSIAGQLEEALVKGWLSKRKTDDYVFRLLRLNRKGADPFESPVWNTWVLYVTKHESPYESMLSVLKTHYSELEISRMLAAATGSESTRGVATRLAKVRLTSETVNGGESAAAAFQRIKFDENGEKLFHNAEFVAKAERYGTKDTLQVLRAHYTDERLAAILNVASQAPSKRTKVVAISLQLQLWQDQRRSADEVFKLLKLEQAGGSVLRSPFLETWVLYAKKLGRVDKKVGEFAAIAVLERRFGVFEFAKMLSAAKSDGALKASSVIDQLQKLQFKKWFKAGEAPNSVSDKVINRQDPRGLDLRGLDVASGYHNFYKAIVARGGLKDKTRLDRINERV